MLSTEPVAISDLSDADLDAVSAGYSFKQISVGNFALAFQTNTQVNAAFKNIRSSQGGDQSNNNNAGNQAA